MESNRRIDTRHQRLDQAFEPSHLQIRPFLSAWLADDLRRRDYGQTLLVIERLSSLGEDLGVLNFYRGETLRQRRSDGDLGLAEVEPAVMIDRCQAR